MEFSCPHCNAIFDCNTFKAGDAAECSSCHNIFIVQPIETVIAADSSCNSILPCPYDKLLQECKSFCNTPWLETLPEATAEDILSQDELCSSDKDFRLALNVLLIYNCLQRQTAGSAADEDQEKIYNILRSKYAALEEVIFFLGRTTVPGSEWGKSSAAEFFESAPASSISLANDEELAVFFRKSWTLRQKINLQEECEFQKANAPVISSKWEHQTKSGNRDRRYKNNHIRCTRSATWEYTVPWQDIETYKNNILLIMKYLHNEQKALKKQIKALKNQRKLDVKTEKELVRSMLNNLPLTFQAEYAVMQNNLRSKALYYMTILIICLIPVAALVIYVASAVFVPIAVLLTYAFLTYPIMMFHFYKTYWRKKYLSVRELRLLRYVFKIKSIPFPPSS